MYCVKTIVILSLSCLIIVFAVGACVGPKSAAKPVYYYTLDDKPIPLTFETPLRHVVRVDRFTASPPFDTQGIVYADKGLHRNTYTHFKWIAVPGELMAFVLARDLKQSGAVRAVLPPDAGTPSTHTIQGWIESFLEEDFSEPAQAALRLSIALIDTRQADPVQRILFQKSYSAKAPCESRTPAALSTAMTTAVATVNEQIIKDVHGYLSTK